MLLHGMIFTKIQLDDFDDIFARFFERLEEDRLGTYPLSQVEWIQMGVINLAACLQYGVDDGLLKKAGAEESARKGIRKEPVEAASTPQAIMVHGVKRTGAAGDGAADDLTDGGRLAGSDGGSDEHPDINGHALAGSDEGEVRSLVRPAFSAEDEESLLLPFRHALRLSFSILSFCLAHPVRKDRLDNSILNPYIPIFLTFLSTIIKQPAALALVERSMPWSALVSFFNSIPRKVEVRVEVSPKLTGGGPLPEDWCLRGMEWVGRRVYERGFWKQKSMSTDRSGARSEGPRSTQAIASEMDVLLVEPEGADVEQSLRDGIVDGETDNADAQDLTARRWRRVAWSLGVFVRHVPGLDMDVNGRKVKIVEGETLDGKMVAWETERVKAREAIEARIRRDEEARGEWAEAESAFEGADEDDYSDDDDVEEDDPDLKELKVRSVHTHTFSNDLSSADSLSASLLSLFTGPATSPTINPVSEPRPTSRSSTASHYQVAHRFIRRPVARPRRSSTQTDRSTQRAPSRLVGLHRPRLRHQRPPLFPLLVRRHCRVQPMDGHGTPSRHHRARRSLPPARTARDRSPQGSHLPHHAHPHALPHTQGPNLPGQLPRRSHDPRGGHPVRALERIQPGEGEEHGRPHSQGVLVPGGTLCRSNGHPQSER